MDDRAAFKPGTAGASTGAEYDARLSRHREAARRRRPFVLTFAAVLALLGIAALNVTTISQLAGIELPALAGAYSSMFGWLLLAVAATSAIGSFVTPSHVTAWATGADGEQRTARQLAPLEADGFRMLHDRRIPMGRANIDHIVIGPPGVFVIESKSYAGRLRISGREISVHGRRTTGWLDEVRREAVAVEEALAAELARLGIAVQPIICVHRAELPWFGSSVDGIAIVSGNGLVSRLRKTKPVLNEQDVALLAELAASRLRPAVRATAKPRVI
ncbi:MAG: NERD domain-containing protein [Chloroflexota bacterium]|nr:NERD domain-containing protein [Chloroflexota bacterium]